MALRSGYYGLKKSLLNKVKGLPGIKSIGSGLSLNSTTGELTATGATVAIEANPEGAATDNLVKLGIGEDIYAVPDAAKTYQTDDATESNIVDADYVPFLDSSAASGAGAPKKSTWTNFISKIKAKITEYVTWEVNSVLGAKNRAYSQTNNSAIANIVSGLSYKVSWDGSATVTLKKNDASGTTIVSGATSPLEFTADENYKLYFGSSADVTNIMVYDAADTDPTYTPYSMTNKELTDAKVDKVTAVLSSSDDLDNIMESGLYNITSKPANSPNQWCTMLVIGGRNDNISQIIFRDYGNSGFIYIRSRGGSPAAWQPWIQFTGAVVS